VLNAGIGGNRVLADGNGPAALARFERDVLAQPGVAAVIVLEGINDIGQARTNPSPSAADLIAGHKQLIDRARARGLRVYGATLTPFAGANYWTAEGEAKRQALNDWIRTARAYDGVIDADAVVRDAANPAKLRAEYDASDHLHLNAAGYEAIAGAIDLAALTAPARPRASGTAVLFIGNSFTFGAGSPVQTWRAETVTDLNHEKIGGVPALFESFTKQAGLDYDVSLETHPGVGLDYHLQMKRDALTSRPWDVVVMHGQSTLDFDKPGDPGKLIATTRQMADVLTGRSPGVRLYLTATWSRADQTYVAGGRWYGQPIAAMARDVRAAYDKAAQTSPAIKAVIPVGEAWLRAIDTGIADPNPYDGITPGQLDLWAKDHYHASTEGYYLEALMVFGALTGRDPRSLGEGECSAFELGMTTTAVRALQQVAFDQLSAARTLAPAPAKPARPAAPARCSP